MFLLYNYKRVNNGASMEITEGEFILNIISEPLSAVRCKTGIQPWCLRVWFSLQGCKPILKIMGFPKHKSKAAVRWGLKRRHLVGFGVFWSFFLASREQSWCRVTPTKRKLSCRKRQWAGEGCTQLRSAWGAVTPATGARPCAQEWDHSLELFSLNHIQGDTIFKL